MILTIMIIIFAILVITGILLVLKVWRDKRDGKLKEPNYRTFFIMGVIWTPIGIISTVVYFLLQIPFYIALPLLAMGLIYLVIGLTNRDKWYIR
ncbi:hypothetical protein ACFLYF_03030 [Chloroflexota bacterium]